MRTKKTIKYIKIIVLIIIFNISTNTCIADSFDYPELNLIPDKSDFFSDNLSFEINGNSNLEKINIIDINLKYNQNELFFDSLDLTNGFCEILISKNINQQTGEINFACATTAATSTLNIAKINFAKIKSGFTEISLADSKFYLHNGQGDSILPNTETLNFFLFK